MLIWKKKTLVTRFVEGLSARDRLRVCENEVYQQRGGKEKEVGFSFFTSPLYIFTTQVYCILPVETQIEKPTWYSLRTSSRFNILSTSSGIQSYWFASKYTETKSNSHRWMNQYVICSFCTVAIGVGVSIGPANLCMGKDVSNISYQARQEFKLRI